jgi:glucose 1-dehydrogenase
MPPSLDNKTVVITGSTRGLGHAMAAAFARAGARVVVLSRTPSAVDAAVAALGGGENVMGMTCDVGDLAQVQRLADGAVERFGRIDVWVNNAAQTAVYGRTVDIPVEEYSGIVRVNIMGTYYGSRVALGHMLSQGGGKLINLSGRGARTPAPFQNAYGPTKAWVVSFTRALAKEYAGRGVDIMTFSPGMVLTGLLTDITVTGRDMEQRFKRFPRILRMFANPPQVPAEMALEIAAAGENGGVYEFLNRRRKLTGMLHELRRALTRSDEPLPQITVRVREPGADG